MKPIVDMIWIKLIYQSIGEHKSSLLLRKLSLRILINSSNIAQNYAIHITQSHLINFMSFQVDCERSRTSPLHASTFC